MDNKMTRNYRKRAEEFWNSYGVKIPTERLEREFKEVAREARQQENEACAKLIEDDSYVRTLGVRRINFTMDAAKAIRSRMEVKNG